MDIDPSIRGKNAYIKAYVYNGSGVAKIYTINSSGVETILFPTLGAGEFSKTFKIPEDAVKMKFYNTQGGYDVKVYDIRPANE